jgi:hypothetical protein
MIDLGCLPTSHLLLASEGSPRWGEIEATSKHLGECDVALLSNKPKTLLVYATPVGRSQAGSGMLRVWVRAPGARASQRDCSRVIKTLNRFCATRDGKALRAANCRYFPPADRARKDCRRARLREAIHHSEITRPVEFKAGTLRRKIIWKSMTEQEAIPAPPAFAS